MASSIEFVQYAAEQMSDAGEITYRKMFGEYGLYCGGIFFALICDDRLFIKITEAGEKLFPTLRKTPPYDGAKNSFLIEDIDNRDILNELVTVTCLALSEKPEKKRRK